MTTAPQWQESADMAPPHGLATVVVEDQPPVSHRLLWGEAAGSDPELLVHREWLVTNGLGGYASGTIAGLVTRRYHGLLIAALPVPLGRTVMLNQVTEELRLPDGRNFYLCGRARPDGSLDLAGATRLEEFCLESGLPVWRYAIDGFTFEKLVLMPHGQNTVFLVYRVLEGEGRVRLRIRPWVHFRSHEAPVADSSTLQYKVTSGREGVTIARPDMPPLRLHLHAPFGALVLPGRQTRDVFYRMEQARGYDAHGTLGSPGYFRSDVGVGEEAALAAGTEPWDVLLALDPQNLRHIERMRMGRLLSQAHPRARRGTPARLVVAADQFVVSPATRVADAARAHALGDQLSAIIAGYHWFTDWGRDTMISLEGLTLLTGRYEEAGSILRSAANYLRDGLIPNLFPEGQRHGQYNTADATLWYFHALDRYLQYTGDRRTLGLLLPSLRAIIAAHQRGTLFGIHVDPADGLLSQGQHGLQLTWMDAKVGDWVVTPRRGKAVEINALWYNALRLTEGWVRESAGDAAAEPYAQAARQAAASFNARFWYEPGGYLYDVVDGEAGDDASMRPNQVFAIALPHPVLDRPRWKPVLDQVTRRLLTPMGLRSLAPGEPDYKPRYDGDLRSRDAAYHQGTVWAWLIGPLVDAWLKVYPEDYAAARAFLGGFAAHLGEACVGSISEIFDAEAPYTPRGCIAQAWSVAEVLRAWVKVSIGLGQDLE